MIQISKIKSLLANYKFKQVNSKVLSFISSDIKGDLTEMHSILWANGIESELIMNSKLSAKGGLLVDGIEITPIPSKIIFREASSIPGENPSVVNRLKFAHFIHQVISQTSKPFTIRLESSGKVVQIKGVTHIKFLGDSIADFRIMQGTNAVRVTVNSMEGTYHTKIDDSHVLNEAHDSLVNAAETGLLNAEIDERDYMTLHQPVAIKASSTAIRNLIMKHIRNGVGIIGDFNKSHFKFNPNKNEVVVKCDKVFKNPTDLKSGHEPYLIVSNSPTETLFDLKGLTVDLVSKRNLPGNSTVIHI